MKITKKYLLVGVLSVLAISLLVAPAVFALTPLPLPNTDYAPSGANMDISEQVTKIINGVLGFLGFIAVVIILIGGFLWMTAAGNDERITKAKTTLGGGLIGLAIILMAWVIVTVVYNLVVTGSVF